MRLLWRAGEASGEEAVSIWGKIIGGVAGFAIGGPLGALVGAAAGHAYDSYRGQSPDLAQARIGSRTGTTGQAARQMAFSVAVVVLGAKMAKADGVVSRAEIDAFKRVFRVAPEDVKTVARIFDAAKQDAKGFEPYATQMATLFRHEPAVLEELLTGLFHIARADGPVSAAERAYLKRVADIFGLDTPAFDRVEAPFAGANRPDPYQVLGISRSVDDAAVKKAYRKLIRENHPDALIAKGMPQEFIDVANERMATINAAYDEIERSRGMT